MIKKPLLLFFLLATSTLLVKAQSKVAAPWPGVPYASAKVFLYNLDNQLYGQYQAWKNGVPNFTLVQPGTSLNAEQAKALETVLNGDTRVLNEGLSKCYEPHHAVFFYDGAGKTVAAFDVCFLCEGVKFYPAKQYKSEIKKYTDAMTKNAQNQLKQIESVFVAAGVPVFKTQQEVARYRDLNMVKKDTLLIKNDQVFNEILKPFKSVKAIESALGDHTFTIDSTYTYSQIRYYDFKGAHIKLVCSRIPGGDFYITDLMVKEKKAAILKGVDIGKTRTEIYKLFEKYLPGGYFYSHALVFEHTQYGLGLVIHFDERATVDHINYYLKH